MKSLKTLMICSFILLSGLVFSQEQNSVLWEISGNGLESPSYLFGTIHVKCPDDIKLSPEAQNALNASEQLVLEIDMDAPDFAAKMQSLSVNEGMKNLKEYNAILTNSNGQELLFLKEDHIENSEGQKLGHFKEDNLFNLHNQEIGKVLNGKILNLQGQVIGSIENDNLLNVNGQSIMTVEGENETAKAKIGLAFFTFLQ